MPLPDDIVEIPLTAAQAAVLLPLVRLQPEKRQGLLFVSVGPKVTPGGTVLRLQAKWLPWSTAQKVLRLIHAPQKAVGAA
jgi:hypothetical protein